MTENFAAQVHKIIQKNTALMTAVVQESTQRVIQKAQVPKAKGGNMPLDTGFLRASGRLSLTGVPTGPVRPPEAGGEYSAPDTVEISGFKLGGTIYWGWSAVYAWKQEIYNDFLGAQLRQWQKTVDEVVRDLRGRMR